MAEFANSSNSSSILKENYNSKKKRGITRIGYAEGGDVTADTQSAPVGVDQPQLQGAPQAPDFISDEQMSSQQAPQISESPDFIPDDQFKSDEDTYGTVKQQLITAAEGLGQGIAGPLAPMAEQGLGVSPEAIRMRAETNPWIHGGSEALGLTGSMLGGFGEGALIAKVGETAATLAKGENLLSKIGSGAARAAAETALMQTGDEVTKMVTKDPNQSVQSAVVSIGLGGLIGGLGGAALGVVNPLWKAALGDKASQMAADFKGRITEHLENPDPVSAVSKELQDHYSSVKSMADEVYGPEGLKAQDIAKVMPEMNIKMSDQASQVGYEVHETIQKMMKKPNIYPERLVSKLQGDLDQYVSAIGDTDINSGKIFNAMQDLKQTVQSYSKYDKFVKPVDEAYDFVKDSKKLASSLRESLEDSSIWEKAADRQKAINKAFVQFKPTLEDFEKKFTSEISGEKQLDPGKVNTYINQLNKPNAEIKQSILRNYLDASDKYKKVINQTHTNLGLETPIENNSLNSVMNTLKEQSLGSKLADIFIKKGLSDVVGKGLGATVGGVAGHAVGAGGFGALLGEHTLGPFFNSILPAIAKPMLKESASADGLKSAIDYGVSLNKSDSMINKAAKGIFRMGSEVLSNSSLPSEKDRNKLNLRLKELQVNPLQLVQSGQNMSQSNKLGHYLKGHDTAITQTGMAAVNYLNSIRPSNEKINAPLDAKAPPSMMEKVMYNRALDIAHQPLVLLKSIKDGTLTSTDLTSISTMYPALYSKLQQKLTDEMITHISKGQTVPYSTRIGLSLFLRQSLDSSMLPSSIQAAQPAPAQQQGSPQVKKSTAKIGDKSNKMSMTQGQAAEEDQLKR